MIINKYSSSPPSSPPPPPTRKKDPRGIGFIDDIGGGVNGLMSCTESLGFESSDERRIDDDEEDPLSLLGHDVRPWTSRKEEWGKKTSRSTDTVKKFPPPLSSLNRKGQPCFFLRPLRKDGTLQLTEVRIYRPEILRAYRGDGRLRLHLIRHDEDEDEDEDENEKEDEDCINVEEEGHDDDDNIEEGKVAENVMREEEEERNVDGEEWKIPVSSTGEGYRRCYEVVNPHDHHHHHVHMWRQHCVTTR